MQILQLPESMRIVDLLRLAKSQGKRLVWRADGFRYRAHIEEVPHADHADVADGRADHRLDCHRPTHTPDHPLAGRNRPARNTAAADSDALALLPVGPGGASC